MPRFYQGDINYYAEFSDGWDHYCRTPYKKWGYERKLPKNSINYWRDLEGAQKEIITRNDLYFDRWLRSRINSRACLPQYYCTGNRFIRITKAFPTGFKCAPAPLNLEEARAMKVKIKAAEKVEAKRQAEINKMKNQIKALIKAQKERERKRNS